MQEELSFVSVALQVVPLLLPLLFVLGACACACALAVAVVGVGAGAGAGAVLLVFFVFFVSYVLRACLLVLCVVMFFVTSPARCIY